MVKPGIRSGHCFYIRIYTAPNGGCIDEPGIPVRKATISRFIESAAKQKAAIVVINLFGREYTIQDVKKGIIGALQPNRNRSIKMVWIITKHQQLFTISRREVFDETIYDKLEWL